MRQKGCVPQAHKAQVPACPRIASRRTKRQGARCRQTCRSGAPAALADYVVESQHIDDDDDVRNVKEILNNKPQLSEDEKVELLEACKDAIKTKEEEITKTKDEEIKAKDEEIKANAKRIEELYAMLKKYKEKEKEF